VWHSESWIGIEGNGLSYPSDEAVMAKIQDGHLDLLGILFTRHSRKAYELCYRMVGDAHTSEDLVQESFLRVLRYRKSFRGEARFSTWLYRIVKNVCLDHIGAQNKENAAFEELKAESADDHSLAIPGDSDLGVVKAAFEALSTVQRELLIMSRIDGVGYREIAAHFGLSEGAARVRVHRTVRELKSNVTKLTEVES
jgi:RNA polymerase sigma-70 factor (ECF subfamily)